MINTYYYYFGLYQTIKQRKMTSTNKHRHDSNKKGSTYRKTTVEETQRSKIRFQRTANRRQTAILRTSFRDAKEEIRTPNIYERGCG